MLIAEAPDIVDWLKSTWDQTLEWDSGNTDKLKKHGFSQNDVDKIFKSDFFFTGEVVGDWGERRFLIYAHLDSKYATVAWTPRENKIRVISCRRSRENEKKDYQKYKKRS